jgi:hypothetical protein
MAGIMQIIRYEGDSDTFIRKHPAEDFAAWSPGIYLLNVIGTNGDSETVKVIINN